MKYHIPYHYKSFVCLGGECPDTCCGGWRIPIDDESFRRYRKVTGSFGERLRRGMDPLTRSFRLKGRYCSFLNEKGLCDIFRELGKDGLCKACRDYPRHREDYGKLQEFMLSMSCPEAARLILEDETQGAGYAYIPRHPHDDAAEKYKGNNRDNHLSTGKIPGRKKRQNEEDREEEQMLAWLLELRETLVCLIKNRSVDFDQRLAMILAFGHDFQRRWDEIRQERDGLQALKARRLLRRLTKRYLSEHAAAEFAGKLAHCQNRSVERMIRISAWMRRLQAFEPVLESWSRKQEIVCRALYHKETPASYELLQKEFCREAADFEQEWENLVLYYLRTYLLGALYDDDVYGKIKMAVFSYAVIREWCLFRYRVTGTVSIEELTAACYRYSREIENSDENLNELEQMLGENPLFYLESMLTVVCGAKTS